MPASPLGLRNAPGPAFVAAAGVEHRGEPKLAHALVEAAALAGCDAVTFQHVRESRLTTAASPDGRAVGRLQPPALPDASLPDLAEAARRHGLRLGLVVTEPEAVRLGADAGAAFFKVVSAEVTNAPLLRAMGRTGLPVVVNGGACTLAEAAEALDLLRSAGSSEVALYHTGPRSPCAPSEADLPAMARLRAALGVPVGYSDRCPGDAVLTAAAALGADLLEKHLRLPGPAQAQGAISLEPEPFAAAVHRARDAWHAAQPAPPPDRALALQVRRSVVAARAIAAGETLDRAALDVRQPGGGIAPRLLPFVVGRRAVRDLAAGEPIQASDIGIEEE